MPNPVGRNHSSIHDNQTYSDDYSAGAGAGRSSAPSADSRPATSVGTAHLVAQHSRRVPKSALRAQLQPRGAGTQRTKSAGFAGDTVKIVGPKVAGAARHARGGGRPLREVSGSVCNRSASSVDRWCWLRAVRGHRRRGSGSAAACPRWQLWPSGTRGRPSGGCRVRSLRARELPRVSSESIPRWQRVNLGRFYVELGPACPGCFGA